MALIPAQSLGVKAATPVLGAKQVTTLPSNQVAAPKTSSPGAYKGVAITPGTDAEVAAQIAKIDSGSSAPKSTPSYGGAIGQIIQQNQNTPATAPTPTFSGIVGQTVSAANNAATTGAKNAGQSYKQSQDYLSALEKSRMNQANSMAAIGSEAIPLEFQQGRQQVIQTQYGEQQSALANAANAAAGLYGSSLTGQGQGITGLQGAATLAAPNPAQYGQTTFNPLTGGYEGNSGLPQETLQQYAQMAANGQYAAIPSSITSNPQLSAQLNAAARQINPSFNPIISTAQGQAAASNALTAGTVATEAAASGYQNAVQNYVSANTAYQQAQGQAGNLVTAMNGINGINAQFANTAVNNLKNQFGDANYSRFIASLAEAQQAYTSLLASVGASTPTVNGQQATQVLSPSATPAQIKAAISALDQAAYAKLTPLYNQISTYQQNLNGGNTGSGGTASAGGYIFVQDSNGKWVPAK